MTATMSVPPPVVANSPAAQSVLSGFLATYGLQSLERWAFDRFVQLGGGQGALDALSFELTQRPEFQARFPAIAMMQKAGIDPVTPQQYIDYENTISQAMRAAGAAPAFYERNSATFNSMVTKALVGGVSAAEATQRIANGVTEALQAPPSVRDAWGQLFGVHGDAAMTSFYIDPSHTLPQLEQMQRESYLVGVGSDQGLGLSQTMAAHLAQLNLSEPEMRQHLSDASQLGVVTPRVGEAPLSNDQVAAATFGLDAQTSAQVNRAIEERRASTGGASPSRIGVDTTKGVAGLGVAPS